MTHTTEEGHEFLLPNDHHSGRPISKLDDVRDKYNVVAAVSDIESARRLIVALEGEGTTPARISLLGAWPIETEPSPPHALQKKVVRKGFTAATVGVAACALLTRRPSRFSLLAAGLFAGLAGSALALARNTGESQAWKHTLVADGSGTASVGVHSSDVTEVVLAEKVMHEFGVLSLNRFEGRYRGHV